MRTFRDQGFQIRMDQLFFGLTLRGSQNFGGFGASRFRGLGFGV